MLFMPFWNVHILAEGFFAETLHYQRADSLALGKKNHILDVKGCLLVGPGLVSDTRWRRTEEAEEPETQIKNPAEEYVKYCVCVVCNESYA